MERLRYPRQMNQLFHKTQPGKWRIWKERLQGDLPYPCEACARIQRAPQRSAAPGKLCKTGSHGSYPLNPFARGHSGVQLSWSQWIAQLSPRVARLQLPRGRGIALILRFRCNIWAAHRSVLWTLSTRRIMTGPCSWPGPRSAFSVRYCPPSGAEGGLHRARVAAGGQKAPPCG